jgi:hypothetical protein
MRKVTHRREASIDTRNNAVTITSYGAVQEVFTVEGHSRLDGKKALIMDKDEAREMFNALGTLLRESNKWDG